MQTASTPRWPQAGWLSARLRLRQRAISLAKRLSRKPAASASTRRGIQADDWDIEDARKALRDKYAKGRPV